LEKELGPFNPSNPQAQVEMKRIPPNPNLEFGPFKVFEDGVKKL